MLIVAAVVVAVLAVGVMLLGIRKIEEGNVGVSFFGGKALDRLLEPGCVLPVEFGAPCNHGHLSTAVGTSQRRAKDVFALHKRHDCACCSSSCAFFIIVSFGDALVCHALDRRTSKQQQRRGARYHVQIPLFYNTKSFPVSIQTTVIPDVPCGTSSGIVIDYERVEVVFQAHKHLLVETVRNYSDDFVQLWVHDLVRHAMNEICSVNTLQEVKRFDDGLEITR